MRTIVDFPEEQVRELDIWCQREKISRAEAVRRAVRVALSTQSKDPRSDAFGAWSGKKLDSREFVDSLRGEWGQ